MGVKRFPTGGVMLPEKKSLTSGLAIEEMPSPGVVAIPLKQHVGVPSRPVVEVGQLVSQGECIAMNDEGLSARIHASIPGEVVALEARPGPGGARSECVVIERREGVTEESRVRTGGEEPGEIRRIVEEAGIVGLGGACFPTHVKLSPSSDRPLDMVIINGAECEPYITVDHRLMLEQAPRVYRGLTLIMRAVGAGRGVVACEVNKGDALAVLEEEAHNGEDVSAVRLDTRYPHGAEKHLIKAVTGREVPLKGLPFDVGIVVNNVQTAVAIADAVDRGLVLSSRVLTASGHALASPRNLRVPLGASLGDVLEYCGGITCEDYRVVVGGPMTGARVDDLSIPVTKGTSGVVVLPAGEYAHSPVRPCIRCGRCVDVCPMYLAPNRIVAFVNRGLHEEAKASGVLDCMECGACAFVCPSKRPLLHWIRQGKATHA